MTATLRPSRVGRYRGRRRPGSSRLLLANCCITFPASAKNGEGERQKRLDLPVRLRSQDPPRKTTRGDLDVEVEIYRKVVDFDAGIGKRVCALRVKRVIDI